MTKQRFTRVSKGAADPSKKACGARHPLHSGLRCISAGRCVIDSHIGVLDGEYVVWGEFFETPHPGLPASAFRVVPLREEAK